MLPSASREQELQERHFSYFLRTRHPNRYRSRPAALRRLRLPCRLAALLAGVIAVLAASALNPAAAQENIASTIPAKVQAAKSGEISLDELCETLISAALESPSVIEYVIGMKLKLPGLYEALGPVLLARTRKLFPTADLEQLQALSYLATVLPESNGQREQVELLHRIAKEIDQLAKAKNIDGLLAMRDRKRAPGIRELADPRISAAVLATTKQLAAQAEPPAALQLLAKVHAVHPHEELRAAARLHVAKIAEQAANDSMSYSSWTLGEPAVQALLTELMPVERDNLITIYSWKALHEIRRNNVETAGTYYNLVVGNRPDPAPENNLLRRELVFAAKGARAHEFAIARLEELSRKGALSLGDRLRLVLRGFYGIGVLLFFLTAVLLIAGCVVFLFLQPQVLRYGMELLLGGRVGSRAEPVESGGTRQPIGYRKPTAAQDEYSRLLGVFGLQDGATEADIKRAFREAVKKYHPDSQGAAGVMLDEHGNVDETFQELRRTYERIMEIRSGWFGKRS